MAAFGQFVDDGDQVGEEIAGLVGEHGGDGDRVHLGVFLAHLDEAGELVLASQLAEGVFERRADGGL